MDHALKRSPVGVFLVAGLLTVCESYIRLVLAQIFPLVKGFPSAAQAAVNLG